MTDLRRFTTQWEDYELIDAGGGKKLERWGNIVTIRPEVQAYFNSGMPFSEWVKKAHWEFIPKGTTSGSWKELKKDSPSKWVVQFDGIKFELNLTKFKHIGLFPEQAHNWRFIKQHVKGGQKFLNLFAYTGAASVVASSVDADVFHCDSVKQLISWARKNAEINDQLGIHWVHEDALKFAQREVKRNNKYQGVIMDPPAWGIGAKNEKWKLEDRLEDLLVKASQLIEKDGFLILNTYSPKVDIAFLKKISHNILHQFNVEITELWMKSTSGKELYYGNMIHAIKP